MVDKERVAMEPIDWEHCGECEQPENSALGPKRKPIYGGWAHRDCMEARKAMQEAGWFFGCLATWRRQPQRNDDLAGCDRLEVATGHGISAGYSRCQLSDICPLITTIW